MSREKMLEAKSLIEKRQYSQARQILETVDHPRAREWLGKLDEIELGNPFPVSSNRNIIPVSTPAYKAPIPTFQDIMLTMTQHDWTIKLQMQNFVQFEKKKLPNAWLAALLIVFFSLLGTLLVCLGIAIAKTEKVTFRFYDDGSLLVLAKGREYKVDNAEDLLAVANIAKGGASYGNAIILGIISFVLYWIFFTPHYYR